MYSRSLEITGVKDIGLQFEVSALFPFLKMLLCLLLSRLWGLDQSQLMFGRYRVLLVLGYLAYVGIYV